jgi:hypothetical protein
MLFVFDPILPQKRHQLVGVCPFVDFIGAGVYLRQLFGGERGWASSTMTQV